MLLLFRAVPAGISVVWQLPSAFCFPSAKCKFLKVCDLGSEREAFQVHILGHFRIWFWPHRMVRHRTKEQSMQEEDFRKDLWGARQAGYKTKTKVAWVRLLDWLLHSRRSSLSAYRNRLVWGFCLFYFLFALWFENDFTFKSKDCIYYFLP